MHPTIPTIGQGSLVARDASPCCTVLHIPSKLRTEALKIWMFTAHSAIAGYVHFLLTNLLESMAVAEYAHNCLSGAVLAAKIGSHGAVCTSKLQTYYTSTHCS